MWGSLGLVAWTHAGYPAALALVTRLRGGETAGQAARFTPGAVALVIAAHDESEVIEEKLANTAALDWPGLEVIVASDGSTDDTVARAQAPGVRVLDLPRGGKVAAQDAAVAATDAEIVAFSDANSLWEPDALRRLVARFADPEVGYVCGRLRLVDESGASAEGLYWRYELWQRAQESRLGSITAGNGGIYAVRRSAYPALGSAHSHDIALPHRLRRAGLRALYEPEAVATEPIARGTWRRNVRMQSRAWHEVLRGGMFRGQPPGYLAALVSHRLLRYGSGLLHLVALGAALARRDRPVLAAHAAFGAAVAAGVRLPRYYAVVTAASVAGLVQTLREGPQTTWEVTR